MSSKKFFFLTKVRFSYSPKEQFKASLPFPLPDSLPTPAYIYLYQHHTYVPYRIASWHHPNKTTLFFTFKEPQLLKKDHQPTYDLYLAWDWLKPQLTHNTHLENIFFCIDFIAIDQNNNRLGPIIAIQQRKKQPLLFIDHPQEIVIPVHESRLHAIDFDQQTVTVQHD